MRQGLTHVYMGPGKGKTTAALGLALRAAGAGWRVCFIQFLKGRPSSEGKALERLAHRVELHCFGRAGFITGAPCEADIEAARRGWNRALDAMQAGDYQLIVLDEILHALALGLIEEPALLDYVRNKAGCVELVLTGQHAPPSLLAEADLVSNIECLKHYHATGARTDACEGIEY